MLEKIIAWSIHNKILVMLFSFLVLVLGANALLKTPIDALPDLSDVQVIVYTEYKGQSPRIIEDQITYPLTTSLVSVPGAKVVRGYSFFGFSLVYIIFQDGTDIYWARSRVLEYLNYAQKRLPPEVVPTLGPDASGVGWVYEYALVSKEKSLQELRSIQDWYLKYQLASIEGVSEVASIGGYVKQYQVDVDPVKIKSYGISLSQIEMAIKKSNSDAGGEVLEMGEAEYMIRGLGYIKNISDLENIPISKNDENSSLNNKENNNEKNNQSGSPIYLRDIAHITIGPEMRRGIVDLDGQGEVAGGIIVMRYGQNALEVIDAVRKKLEVLKAGLPADVQIVPTYDRSLLIHRAVDNLRDKLLEEILIVALVCGIFLLHLRSAAVAIFTLPAAILISFLIMRWQGINANIMSLGGIAIAIGAMVDAAIILIENTHKHLEAEARLDKDKRRDHWEIVKIACQEVGPTLFWSLLVITVSFLPVFTLEAQAGRLFKPLAFTKTYSMAAAAILGITLVPILIGYFVRGKMLPENKNPINRILFRLYHALVQGVLRYPLAILVAAIFVISCTIIPFSKLGSEFMPSLFEGDLLYMPTTLPGISITKSKALLQQTDKIIRFFPEVEQVFGKIGRAETATDPAGIDMMESTIRLKPEKEWRKGMSVEKLIEEMDAALTFPGLTNSWTMPIKNRIDMLSTGIKTPVGIKLSGPDLDSLQKFGQEVEALMRTVPHTSSAFAERAVGGNYLDIKINREAAARYGLAIDDIQNVIRIALGGMVLTTTVEGLERYGVRLRYDRELRQSMEDLQRVMVPIGNEQIPLGQVATIEPSHGPMVIRTEGTRPNAWVFVDMRGIDMGTYIEQAQKIISSQIKLPPGYNLVWSGEFEMMQNAQRRLAFVIPITLILIFILLFLNTRSLMKTFIVFLAIPFSLVGAIWFLYFLNFNLSVAVWVGLIALAGLDAETGVVMLLYLDRAYEQAKSQGKMQTIKDLIHAIDQGAVQRIRPKVMTAAVILAGLVPILWSHGAGSDVMKRIAAPMVGGVITSVLMELLLYPVLFFLWKKRSLKLVS